MARASKVIDRRKHAAQIADKLEARVRAETARPEVRRYFEDAVAVARAVADGADVKSVAFRRDVAAFNDLTVGAIATSQLIVDSFEGVDVIVPEHIRCMGRCLKAYNECKAGNGGGSDPGDVPQHQSEGGSDSDDIDLPLLDCGLTYAGCMDSCDPPVS